MRYADVIIDISHERVDRSFQYRVPEVLSREIRVGQAVLVPFGRGKKPRQGYVIGLSDEAKIDPAKVKDILSIDEKRVSVESELIELAAWMRERYGGTFFQCLSTVMPVKRRVKKRGTAGRSGTERSAEDSSGVLVDAGGAGLDSLPASFPKNGGESAQSLPPLNADQRRAVERFTEDYHKGFAGKYLLCGVTGSGKTRVYLEMMDAVVASGKNVIVLIPEIALTRQNILRFSARFGNAVAVLHSRLSQGERYEVYEKAERGEIRIVLGPRSALFVPFSDLGLIIVDEEHETSYKSEQMPKYHAREVALKRASLCGASVVFGSATPSLESVYRVKKKQFTFLPLPNRVAGRPLPKSVVVDMRKELKNGNATLLSTVLQEKIEETLNKNEQVLLFLNRRGLAGFVSCKACGYVAKCPHCDVSLHQHRDRRLKCHYCGYERPMPDACPECGSTFFGGFRVGTQGVESLLKKAYPTAKVLRMDADTTKRKGDHERILAAFAAHKADILLGTQMIVKGHDFPGVTLVGILAADMSLNSGDFGGGERTFDLLVQASGRAGRGEIPGEVVIQTYQPEHYAIRAAAKSDLNGFVKRELSFRRLMAYPPVSHLLLVQITAGSGEEGGEAAGVVKQLVAGLSGKLMVAGPIEAMIARIKDRFRFAVYIKSPNYQTLIDVKDRIEALAAEEDFREKFSHTRIFFDFDPMGVF